MLTASELVLALRNEVLYINVKENTVEKCELPKEKVEKKEEDGEEGSIVPGVQNMTVSPDRKYMAVSTREKYLYIFELAGKSPFKLDQVAKIVLSRVSNRLRFSRDSQQLLIADKTGDCFLWKFLGDGGLVAVCGHLSMVMDVLFTDDESALITCDRDEKVRVTSFPDTHNVLAYCMGHREYVGQVELLPHNHKMIVSISGDQTVRIWDFGEGKELFKVPLAGPGASMTCWKTGEDSSVIACHIYQSHILQIYEIQSSGEALKMRSMKQVELSPYTAFKDIHNEDGAIVTLSLNKSEDKSHPQLEKFQYDQEERTYKSVDVTAINTLLRQHLPDLDANEERDEVAILFKKRVDNLSLYHEQKKRRIEEKSK